MTVVTLTKRHSQYIPAKVFLVKTNAQFSCTVQQMHGREVFDQAARVTQPSCLSAQPRLE